MLARTVTLVALVLTALGSIGGLVGALIQPASYQAEAFVVVYAMPQGFNDLISPDEANTINAYYAAGALQNSVIQRVLYHYHSLTAAEIREAIQVSIVAYTPLTRVTAIAASPQVAVTLANAVATAWVDDTGKVITDAYLSTLSALQSHEQQLSDQLVATQNALQAPGLSAAKAQSLQAQFASLENASASTDANLTALERQRYTVAGNSYVATPADAADVTRTPDVFKSLTMGGALGLALGVLCALWLIRVERADTLALVAAMAAPIVAPLVAPIVAPLVAPIVVPVVTPPAAPIVVPVVTPPAAPIVVPVVTPPAALPAAPATAEVQKPLSHEQESYDN